MLRLLLWPVTMYVNLVGLLLRLMGRAVGFCVGLVLAALGGLGDLVLWVLSTMVESDLPATSMDGLGRIRYTTPLPAGHRLSGNIQTFSKLTLRQPRLSAELCNVHAEIAACHRCRLLKQSL